MDSMADTASAGCSTALEFPLEKLCRSKLVVFDAVGTLLEPRVRVPHVYAEAAKRHGSRLPPDVISNRWQVALRRYSYWGVVPRSIGNCVLPWRKPVRTSELWEKSRWRRIVSFVIDDVVGPDFDRLFEELWSYFADARHWMVSPALRQLWEALRSGGIRCAIASNYDYRLRVICEALPPLNEADYLFTSASVGFPKPHPKFFEHIERTTKLSGSQIAMIGDDWECDIVGPSVFGWQTFLWVKDRQQLFPH